MRRTLCLAACLVAAPALAQQTGPSTVTVTGATAKPKQICRSISTIGSLMTTRSCHSAQEWSDIDSSRAVDVNAAADRLVNLNHVQGDVTGGPRTLPVQVGH